MTDSKISPPKSEEHGALADENKQLRSKIKELEFALTEATAGTRLRSKTTDSDGTNKDLPDRINDIANRSTDEVDRLFRGVFVMVAESLRSTAEVVNAFSSKLSKRQNEARSEDYEGSRITKTTDDLLAAVESGLRESLKIPRRSFEGFLSAYDDSLKS